MEDTRRSEGRRGEGQARVVVNVVCIRVSGKVVSMHVQNKTIMANKRKKGAFF